MAQRYSGDVTLRLTLVRMKGNDGKLGLFYKASIACPGTRAQAILSLRECKVSELDARDPVGYDQAARAFIDFADTKMKGKLGKFCAREGGSLEILRVQQAPCPVGGPNGRDVSRKCCGKCRPKHARRDPSTYAEAKKMVETIRLESAAASKALQAFPKGAMGLTPDAIKSTPEFKAAKARFNAAFARERSANAWFVKTFAKEYRAERAARGRDPAPKKRRTKGTKEERAEVAAAAFDRAVAKHLVENYNATPPAESWRRFVVHTAAGPLEVGPNGTWISMQFREPERANLLLPGEVYSHALNHYSGKWNIHETGLAANLAELDRMLKKVKP